MSSFPWFLFNSTTAKVHNLCGFHSSKSVLAYHAEYSPTLGLVHVHRKLYSGKQDVLVLLGPKDQVG